MGEQTRPIGWIRASRYEAFPQPVRDRVALTIAAVGGKADIAKPLKGLGSGVMQIAVRYRSDAARRLRCRIGRVVVGGSCVPEEVEDRDQDPQVEIDLVKTRLRRLKRELMK